MALGRKIVKLATEVLNDKKSVQYIEKVLYGAAGTLTGIAGGKTARDLQDYYIGKSGYGKGGRIGKKWYYPRRRFKGDIVLENGASYDTFDETHGPAYTDNNYRRYNNSNFSRRRKTTKSCWYWSRRSHRWIHHKGCLHRTMVKRTRYKRR